MCEIDIGNPKTRKALRLLSSGTKLFITFELKVIRHEEGETQSFYADFSICPKPCVTPHLQTTFLASAGSESQPSRLDAGTQLCFSQIPQILSASSAWRHSHPLVNFLSGVLFWHLWMTHPPCACVNTCLHLTNPCTEPKGSHSN